MELRQKYKAACGGYPGKKISNFFFLQFSIDHPKVETPTKGILSSTCIASNINKKVSEFFSG